MSPSEFRALLEKATARPWATVYSGSSTFNIGQADDPQADDKNVATVYSRELVPANAAAIVATMNRAELFAELWDAQVQQKKASDDWHAVMETPEGAKNGDELQAALQDASKRAELHYDRVLAVLAKLEACP